MQNLKGTGATGHQPALTSHISAATSSTTTSNQTRTSRSTNRSPATPALPIPRPSYHATQQDAVLTPPRTGDTPPRPINTRQALKRPHEPNGGAEASADGKGDKKAKAAKGGNGIKQEHESEAPLQTEAAPHVPEFMADGVDALLTLVLHANPSPPRPLGPLSSSRPSSPPLLEAAPLTRLTESKSSSESAAAPLQINLHQAVRYARQVSSFVGLSGPARTQQVNGRFAVFETYAKALKSHELAKAFHRAGEYPPGSGHHTAEQNAAADLHLLEAQALVQRMTRQQRQDALRKAKRPVELPELIRQGEPLRRRVQLISLYRAMDPAALEDELAATRREAELLDMDEAQLLQTVQLRAEQFAAMAALSTPAQRSAELARLRQPGRLVHMEGEALRRALRLQTSQFWASLLHHTPAELLSERAAALAMPQELQDMGEAAWQRTLHLRAMELEQNLRATTASATLPALREALVPTTLVALRGPALERALALRKELVQQLFKILTPQDRDRALAEARTPATLADVSGQALDTAIRLRKLVFEEYFRTVPPSDGAAVTARVELAAALDTTELASQPEADVARAALLRLALVGVAHQHTRPVVTTQALPSSASSLSSSHTTSSGVIASVVHTATGSNHLNHSAPSSSSSRYVMNLASLPSSRYTMNTGSLLTK